MLKTNHFECFFNQLFYGVRQLGNGSNLARRCSNMSASALNHHGGSDEYSFDSMHDFWSGFDQEPTWQ